MSNNVTPLVSICSITYNHKPYIRQCLDSLLLQKTNFIYEIIINDDCSTDGTTEIIKEYASKYPNLIHPIFHDENQYSKGVRGMFAKFCFPQARGKYIAMCEGDDYWTDPLKLQKQVDILEQRENVSIVFNKVQVVAKDDTLLGWTIPYGANLNEGLVSLDDYLKEEFYKGCWTFHTSSVMYRNDIVGLQHSLDSKFRLFPHGDMAIMLFNLEKGYGYYIADCCSTYRLFSGGYNSNLLSNPQKKILESERKIEALLSYDQNTKYRYHKYLKRGIIRQQYDLDVFLKNKYVILKPRYWGILIERLKSRFNI